MTELPEPEIYTPERIAEFLLNNSLDAGEYDRAVQEALAMGIDPRTIAPECLDRSQPWQRPELYISDTRIERRS